MEGELAFGKMFGVTRKGCFQFFPPCLIWLCIKMLWWQKCGIVARRKEAGSLTFLRPLNEREMEEVEICLLTLHKQNISPLGEDRLL